MRHALIAITIATLVAGCDEHTAHEQGGEQQPQAQQQGDDNGFLWAMGGYLLGRATAPAPAPAPAPQAYIPAPHRNFGDRPENLQRSVPRPAPSVRGDTPVPDPAPKSVPTVPRVAPSVVPAPSKLPAPTPASKPSYQGPSSYKPAPPPRVTYSAPSRSSSPTRR